MATTDLPVHTGVWTNWTHGAVYGLTLTLTNRTGLLFVAFLAMYVQVVGSHFWQLLAFIIFRMRLKDPTDGLHLQHEAILRNADSGVTALMQIMATGWAWRGRAQHSMRRSFSYGTAGAVHRPSLCDSWISSRRGSQAQTPEVLVAASPLCGDFELKNSFGFTRNTTGPMSEADVGIATLLSSSFYNSLITQSSTYIQAMYNVWPMCHSSRAEDAKVVISTLHKTVHSATTSAPISQSQWTAEC